MDGWIDGGGLVSGQPRHGVAGEEACIPTAPGCSYFDYWECKNEHLAFCPRFLLKIKATRKGDPMNCWLAFGSMGFLQAPGGLREGAWSFRSHLRDLSHQACSHI